jgi:hypothetical protein
MSCLEGHTDRATLAGHGTVTLNVARDPGHSTFFLQPPGEIRAQSNMLSTLSPNDIDSGSLLDVLSAHRDVDDKSINLIGRSNSKQTFASVLLICTTLLINFHDITFSIRYSVLDTQYVSKFPVRLSESAV